MHSVGASRAEVFGFWGFGGSLGLKPSGQSAADMKSSDEKGLKVVETGQLRRPVGAYTTAS